MKGKNLQRQKYISPKQLIIQALNQAKNLKVEEYSLQSLLICQLEDDKRYELFFNDILEVFPANLEATENFSFQVNLRESRKILITSQWIGFPPHMYSNHLEGLISQVVTTKDLKNLIVDLQKAFHKAHNEHEIYLLEGLFFAVLEGGEQVGFDFTRERQYFKKIIEREPKFRY